MYTADQLTLFAAGSLASHTVTPGSVEAQMMTAHYGRKCSESYANHSQLGSLARMLLDSSIWDSTIVYQTWKVSVTPARRLLFLLVPSAPDTVEIGSGLLATPTVTGNQTSPPMMKHPSCANWLLPTPAASDYKGSVKGESLEKRRNMTRGVRLEEHLLRQSQSPKQQLNPSFLEELMGFPTGWTELNP